MINVMENKVLGPLIQRRFEEGLERGLEQGLEQARLDQRELLLEQLSDKFGSVPAWAVQQLQGATVAELRTWAKRIIKSASLEETFR